jgi:hypothetical protein
MTASSPVTSRLLFHLVDVQLQRSTASTNASKLTCVVMFMPGLLSGVIGYLRWSFGIILASIQLLARSPFEANTSACLPRSFLRSIPPISLPLLACCSHDPCFLFSWMNKIEWNNPTLCLDRGMWLGTWDVWTLWLVVSSFHINFLFFFIILFTSLC